MKAIILAGGTGSRLRPTTLSSCKQLLPVYDKPAIYYPFSLCLIAGIEEILIISTREAMPALRHSLKDGAPYGCSIEYQIQEKPKGIADAFLVGEDFLDGNVCLLLLGDNILVKSGFSDFINNAEKDNKGATVFGFPVANSDQFGVIELDRKSGTVLSLEEKPKQPKSNLAAIGMYIYDGSASQRAKSLKPSSRGELEITDLNIDYLKDGKLLCKNISRGDFWTDMGTFEALNDCSSYIRLHQKYTGMLIGSPEESAYRSGRITKTELSNLVNSMSDNSYSRMLRLVLTNE